MRRRVAVLAGWLGVVWLLWRGCTLWPDDQLVLVDAAPRLVPGTRAALRVAALSHSGARPIEHARVTCRPQGQTLFDELRMRRAAWPRAFPSQR